MGTELDIDTLYLFSLYFFFIFACFVLLDLIWMITT